MQGGSYVAPFMPGTRLDRAGRIALTHVLQRRAEAVMGQANRLLMMAMPCGAMAFIRSGGAEILQHVDAHRTGAPAIIAGFLDALIYAFPKAYFSQCVPNFRLKSHAGAT
jgi:hypothetical protein